MIPSEWTKAMRSSGNGGSCVEVRRRNEVVDVRDTKDHGTGPTLTFTEADFNAFLDGVREGEFDPRNSART